MIPLPNFDVLERDEVFKWCTMTRAQIARALLLPHQSRIIPQAISNYVWNKYTAMELREKGDIARALVYEHICDMIYNSLPQQYRW